MLFNCLTALIRAEAVENIGYECQTGIVATKREIQRIIYQTSTTMIHLVLTASMMYQNREQMHHYINLVNKHF